MKKTESCFLTCIRNNKAENMNLNDTCHLLIDTISNKDSVLILEEMECLTLRSCSKKIEEELIAHCIL